MCDACKTNDRGIRPALMLGTERAKHALSEAGGVGDFLVLAGVDDPQVKEAAESDFTLWAQTVRESTDDDPEVAIIQVALIAFIAGRAMEEHNILALKALGELDI